MEQNNYNGALQKPVGSGFNGASTTSDVIKGMDLNGKIAIVTGGDGGLGLEITKTNTLNRQTLGNAAYNIVASPLHIQKTGPMNFIK